MFPDGTNHFANAGKPGDSARLNEYTSGPTATLADEIIQGLHELLFLTQTSRRLLMQSSKLWTPRSEKRPFRIHIDPANDGAEVVNGVADRVRVELLRNMGLADLLRPTARSAKGMHFPTTNRKQLSEP